MLGWGFKKGLQAATGATDAPADADTTQFEAPDTPAPVFAARAIKHALFGTPAVPRNEPTVTKRVEPATAIDATADDSKSPAKPTGILLTPGTATARRKRVSFGHDVKTTSHGDMDLLAANPDGAGSGRKKTTLQQALENSRAKKGKKSTAEAKDTIRETVTVDEGKIQTKPTESVEEEESDGEWEDEICNHDVTVDLNEPHSRSGKYWQSQFNKYHEDARAEMANLVKYKHLAKLYAQKKDLEAASLNEKLREQQDGVAKMEQKIRKLEAQVADKRRRGDDTENATAKKLADKTAMAGQYRNQVKELEQMLKDYERSGPKTSRSRAIDTSPRTEETLLEVQQELKQARSELRQTDRLRKDVKRLESALSAAREDNKQLREARDSARDDLRKLRQEHNNLKENAKKQRIQALQVLNEKDRKIAELEQDVKALKAKDSVPSRSQGLDAAMAEHNKTAQDLRSDIESFSKPSVHENTKHRPLPTRSMSADDLTIDMTQRSLADDTYPRPDGTWSDSLWDVEEDLKRDKKQHLEARKRDREQLTDDFAIALTKPIEQPRPPFKAKQPSSRPRSRVSNVLNDLVNESSPRGTPQKNASRRVPSNRKSSLKPDDSEMHGALDKLTSYQRSSTTTSRRPLSYRSEAPAIDLVQDRFARLGGPDINQSVMTANTSRCALMTADRKAAALARVAQKKLERQNLSRLQATENMEP